MRPSEALSQHRNEIAAIISRNLGHSPRIFGSVARGTDTEDSDLDLLIEPAAAMSITDLARMELHLETLLGVRVHISILSDIKAQTGPRIMEDSIPL